MNKKRNCFKALTILVGAFILSFISFKIGYNYVINNQTIYSESGESDIFYSEIDGQVREYWFKPEPNEKIEDYTYLENSQEIQNNLTFYNF